MTNSRLSLQAGAAATAGASIRLKTSLLVPDLHSEEIQLTGAIATMDALLREIGARAGFNMFSADAELIDFLDVRLNGTPIAYHPAGLNTRLQPGDSVLVRLVPIGGG